MNTLIEAGFALEVVDSWPPVAKEYLFFSQIETAYRLETAPLFLVDFSVGDLFELSFFEKSHDVKSWTHLEKSQRSTIWLKAFDGDPIEDVLDCLKSYGCNVERLEKFNLCSIDIPVECSEENINRCISRLDDDAVAFPSFRHGRDLAS